MDTFIGRQPIFDKNLNLIAYEILFRSGSDNCYKHLDGNQATLEVIHNTFVTIGIERLTGGKRAFINFTEKLLTDKIATILPKDLVTVEILENVEPSDEIIEVCRQLKKLGYTIALDDFTMEIKYDSLIKLADIIKVDFMLSSQVERQAIIDIYGNSNIKFLAEKVETFEEFEQAKKMGYSYFQGYFFSKPIIISAKEVPRHKIQCLKMFERLMVKDMDLDEMENFVKRDVSLSYKLLKLVNSSSFGFKGKIHSIKQALCFLGEKEALRWIQVMLIAGIGEDGNNEALTLSLVRARFMELFASRIGLQHRAADLFLMGIFSLIDVLMNQPMEELLEEIPLENEIKAALKGQDNIFRKVYKMSLCCEKAQWSCYDKCALEFKINTQDISQCYIDALKWSNECMLKS